MGAKTIMDSRGHHICRIGAYEIRQQIIRPRTIRQRGTEKKTSGSSEIFIYRSKKKIEGKLTSVIFAAQKAYDMLKTEGKELNVSKKVIAKYNIK